MTHKWRHNPETYKCKGDELRYWNKQYNREMPTIQLQRNKIDIRGGGSYSPPYPNLTKKKKKDTHKQETAKEATSQLDHGIIICSMVK